MRKHGGIQILGVVERRRAKRVAHVAQNNETKNAHKKFLGKTERTGRSKRLLKNMNKFLTEKTTWKLQSAGSGTESNGWFV